MMEVQELHISRRVLMIKLQVSYENEVERMKLLEALKKQKVKKISGPKKTGKYYRIYIYIES